VKVGICARYLSDNQREAFIGDKLRVCRSFAERQGSTIAEEYSDHAVSGATLLRPGFQSLMRDALNRRFDVVLAESLDRFSRDREDTAGLFKRLTFAAVIVSDAGRARHLTPRASGGSLTPRFLVVTSSRDSRAACSDKWASHVALLEVLRCAVSSD
jgi:hypothetical protein